MKKVVFLFTFIFLVKIASAENYNFLKPEVFKGWIESGKKMYIVDIQKEEEFQKRHIKGSIGTGAYPVKSEQDKAKLDIFINEVKNNNLDIVIVCPRGGGAAKNAYDYLKSKGISEKRLYILEGGIQGFPYGELCQK